MKEYGSIIIWALVIGVVFIMLWRKGLLLRMGNYVSETREELRKCSWPTRDELKGSTLVVLVSIVLLGGFTILGDFLVSAIVKWVFKQV